MTGDPASAKRPGVQQQEALEVVERTRLEVCEPEVEASASASSALMRSERMAMSDGAGTSLAEVMAETLARPE